jgi:hypothetical protein
MGLAELAKANFLCSVQSSWAMISEGNAKFDCKAARASTVHHQFFRTVVREVVCGALLPEENAAEQDIVVPRLLIEGFNFIVHLGQQG